jgi:plasmid stabilization system protein ParE
MEIQYPSERGVPAKRNVRRTAALSKIEPIQEEFMPRGDKSSYTSKQKRKAEHIEESYEERGVSKDEAERRAWATVNKESGGGKKSGSGRGKPENRSASRRGGKLGGKASASRPKAARSAAAKKAAATRKRRSG